MGKISVGRAIGDAYDLTFGKYPTVFGVVWLPLLAIAVGEYFIFVPFVRILPDLFQFAAQHPHDRMPPPQFTALNGYIQLFNLAILLVGIWMRVGVTKAALDLPRGPHFAYLFVGMDELRVVGAYVVFIALLYGAIIAAAIVVGVVAVVVAAVVAGGAFSHFDSAWLKSWAIGGTIGIFVAIFGALIYFQTRLMFLMVPVTVAEKRFGLWRSWELSKGNFWRIVVIAIGTVSPLVLFEMVLLIAIYVPIVIALIAMLHDHPEALHGQMATRVAIMTAAFRSMIAVVPFTAILGLVLAPIFCGLMYSPSAFAYRSLMEKSGGKVSAA